MVGYARRAPSSGVVCVWGVLGWGVSIEMRRMRANQEAGKPSR